MTQVQTKPLESENPRPLVPSTVDPQSRPGSQPPCPACPPQRDPQ